MKKFLALLLSVLIVFPSTHTLANEKKVDTMNLNCRGALLMEFDSGKVIYEYNPHEKVAPASVTKVMTMLLTMEAVDSGKVKLTDKVVASARVKSMGGSTMFLDEGEVRTVEELLKGVAIESANDAALALGEFFGGNEEEFVKQMNQRAKELGMNDTHFMNCYGFYDKDHYTSAYDIAIMSRELLRHKKILEYTTIWMETISEGRFKPFTLVNRNKMVKAYKGCDGLKTGFTKEAMYCISATAKRGDIRFISVVLGADTIKNRNAQAARLLDYGFAKYESVKLINAMEEIQEIKINKANPSKAKVVAKDDLSLVFEKGNKPKYEKKVELYNDIKLPLKKGDTVGIIKAVEGDKVLGKVEVVVDCDMKKVRFIDMLGRSFKGWIDFKE